MRGRRVKWHARLSLRKSIDLYLAAADGGAARSGPVSADEPCHYLWLLGGRLGRYPGRDARFPSLVIRLRASS